jgi:hypothetical protein
MSNQSAESLVNQFDVEGYAVLRAVFDPTLRVKLRKAAEGLLASDIRTGRDQGADGKDGFRGCIGLEPQFLQLATLPSVLRPMVALLSPNIHLLSSHLVALPSPPEHTRSIRVPGRHGWHRDMYGVSADLGYAATPRLAIKCAFYLTPPLQATGLTMILPGSHQLLEPPVIPDGSIDPPGAITPDVGEHDALLFENRTWHAGGVNRSGAPRLALILQYGYRWLASVDDQSSIPADASPIMRQLLGAPDRAPDGSLAKGAGAEPLRALARHWIGRRRIARPKSATTRQNDRAQS